MVRKSNYKLLKATLLLTSVLVFRPIMAQDTIYDTLIHANLDRAYLIYEPANLDSISVPLVLNFHGYTSNMEEQFGYSNFAPIADTAGFLLVQPNGLPDQFGTTHWNVGWVGSQGDDVGFVEALLDTLLTKYDIDTTRIYSTGMSNGGFFSYKLACEIPNRIAAIASVTGSMQPNQKNNCSPNRAIPIMQIHGTTDETVAYNGSFIADPIDSVVNYWKRNNGTRYEVIDSLPDINMSDGSTVVHYHYSHGDSCSDVELYKIFGGGHDWPNSPYGDAGTNYDFDASEKIWQFFAKYNLHGRVDSCPEPPEIPIDTIDTTSIKEKMVNGFKIYPNPVEQFITIELSNASNPFQSYTVTDLTGKVLLTGYIKADKVTLDLSKLDKGLYLIQVEEFRQRIIVH